MCAVCGCGPSHERHPHAHGGDEEAPHRHPHPEPGDTAHGSPRVVRLEQDLLAKNDAIARQTRAWLESRGVVAINLTSSPGAGKTTLLEGIIPRLREQAHVCVIEGDQETDRDAERIRRTGCPVVQINTGAGCHLDADMVRRAVESLDPPRASLLLVENVGNLVCPALFDIGENAKVVVMSITEGEDKPLKYPHMFRAARAVVVSKMDLLPHLHFDLDLCLKSIAGVNPAAELFFVSSTRGEGLEALCRWMTGAVHSGNGRA